MADENKEENKQQHNHSPGANIGKTFNDIVFSNVEDKYTLIVQYNSNAELLSLKLINQTTKNVFTQHFNKEKLHKITDKCQLKANLIVKMLIDTLESKELTAKNIRIFLLPNIKQATIKSEEIRSIYAVPDAMNIPTGFQPKLNNNSTENNQLENCLLFVLHFNNPPYLYVNYCFIITEKDVSENDKLGMKLNDLQNEIKLLKNTVESQQQQINKLMQLLQTEQEERVQLSQTNGVLSQRMQQLEIKVDNESKMEEIELNLINNWVRWSNDWSTAKAFKVGNIVYLTGLIKNGSSNEIATLPDGWRPTNHKMCCVFSNVATRVDVYTNGIIKQIHHGMHTYH